MLCGLILTLVKNANKSYNCYGDYMNFSLIPKSAPENNIRGGKYEWADVNNSPFSVHGVFYSEKDGFLRIEKDTAGEISGGVKMLCNNTAGGRVRFKTDSPFIAVSVTQENNILLPHIPLCSQSGLDLYGDGKYIGTFMPKMNIKSGFCAVINTSGEMVDYTINMPLYDNVKKMYISLSPNANVEKSDDYRIKSPIAFYGSSITQGASASRPGNCYTARTSQNLNADYINLGFAANCHGEKKMAEYIGNLSISALVLDYDHNCKDEQELKENHYTFYKTVREKNSLVPIVIMSAPDILNNKEKFFLRREIIKTTYETAKAEGDNNVYFLDGEQLFAGDASDTCTVDGIHPNDFGFYRISCVLTELLNKIL